MDALKILQTVQRGIYWIVNNVVLGFLVLHIFFYKDTLANPSITMAYVIIILIWSIILSIPFNYFVPNSVSLMNYEFKTKAKKIAEKRGQPYHSSATKEDMEKYQEINEIPFNIVTVAFIYIIARGLYSIDFTVLSKFGISQNLEYFISAMILGFILREVIAKPYKFFLHRKQVALQEKFYDYLDEMAKKNN